VEPEDWDSCQSWKPSSGRVALRPCIGIHPQCACEVRPEGVMWLEQMRSQLLSSPSSLVGEIGLDRNIHFKPFFESHQQAVFRDQLRLAAEFHRPVSVHCVKADAAMLEMFKEVAKDGCLPPTICMHSFAGSIETARMIIKTVEGRNTDKCRVFFGFNAWTNLYKKDIARLVTGLIEGPLGTSRFLMESDWNPADFAFPGSDKRDVDKILLWGVSELAAILGMDARSVAQLLAANTRLFLEPICQGSSGYPIVSSEEKALYSLSPALQHGLLLDAPGSRSVREQAEEDIADSSTSDSDSSVEFSSS